MDEPEIEPGVVAKEATPDGHEIKVLRDGRVIKCSTCDEIRNLYKTELANHPDLKTRLDDIEAMADSSEKAKLTKYLEIELENTRRLESGSPDGIKISGSPDAPHELPEAIRLGQIEGGGEIKFFGGNQEGIEGVFIPKGSTKELPFSLKDFTGTGKKKNLITKINKNSNHITNAGHAGKARLYAETTQFDADDMVQFLNNGPVKNMPTEGVFEKLIFECSDGVVIVDSSGVYRL